MNKSQLTEAVAKAEDLPLKKAEEVVNTVFHEMEKALIRGERMEIRGLGSFKVKRYDGYKGGTQKTTLFQGGKRTQRKSGYRIIVFKRLGRARRGASGAL